MNRLVQELIRPFLEEETKPNIGYRAGRFNPNSPAERLKDKGIGMVNSKVGLLGTGHYFMGNLEDAQKLKKQLGYPVISKINLDSYNLYRPNDPVNFYENLKATTHYLHGLKPKDLDDPQIKENVKDAIRGFAEYLGLDPKKTAAIFKQYLIDIFKRNDGDLLSNRLLSNYDGIDLRGTDFDDFGAGSIIFNGKLKDGTYSELTDLNEGVKDLRPKIQAIMAKHQISAKEFSDQLKKGTEVEKEHTSNPKTAMKIALDHIDENPKYYDILATVGLEERITFKPEFTKDEVEFIEDKADNKMQPEIDIDLSSNHFFDRLNDPRNYPDIEPHEIEDFFDKLADKKEEFILFLKKYKQIVTKDGETNINIPFMKAANKAIAKTVMRKRNFKTPNPILSLEEEYTPQKDELQSLILDFTSFLVTDGMKLHPFPKIKFEQNKEEANNPLGTTAYYNPEEQSITLFILNRHPKDILRSYSHELVHHMQNLEGRLKPMTTTNVHEDDELAEMEKEAHELGSLNLRKWEDSLKQ